MSRGDRIGCERQRYTWKTDVPYRMHFKIDLGDAAKKTTLEGLTTYTPSNAQAKTDDEHESGEENQRHEGFVVEERAEA